MGLQKLCRIRRKLHAFDLVSDRRWLVKQMDDAFRERDTKGVTASRDSFYVQAEQIMRSPAVQDFSI